MKNELSTEDYYGKLKRESQTLESRIEGVTLSNQEINKITKRKTIKTIKEEGLNVLGPLGHLTSIMMRWHEDMEEDVKKLKEQKLIEGYFIKTDEQLDTVNKLKEFVTDPYGFTIFSKIRSILNDTPPDSELIDHLSTLLKNIVMMGNFDQLFDQTKFVLGQIERITPQGLTLIADNQSWPIFEKDPGGMINTGTGKLESDFHKPFSIAYAKEKGIKDDMSIEIIMHSVRELVNANIIEAYSATDDDIYRIFKCKLTIAGDEVRYYLSL